MHDTITRTLPDLDVAQGEELGNEILLSVASSEKTKRVKGSGGRRSFESRESRAWTRSGNVD